MSVTDKNKEDLKDLEPIKINLSDRQIKWLRGILFILLIFACFFVVEAAWIDLYNPGTKIARDYQNYAIITIVAMVGVALPLWIKKIEKIEEWKKSVKNIDDPVLRNKAWWGAIKPIVKQLIIVGVLTIVAYFLINAYFHIPQSVIDNYTFFYHHGQNLQKNLQKFP